MNKVDKEILAGFEEFVKDVRAGRAKKRDIWQTEKILISKIRCTRPSRFKDDLRPLIASIRQFGILEYIRVWQTPRTFRVIMGSRRVEACKKLKIKTIPAIILNGRDWAYNRALSLWEERYK